MNEPQQKKKITLARWLVRALAISASTLAAVALIKGEFQAGGILSLGWLSIVLAEKRLFRTPSIEPD